jgi:hypothetical protein
VITGRKPVCENLRGRGISDVYDYETVGWRDGDPEKNTEWFKALSPDIVITDTIALYRNCDGIACRDFWTLSLKCGVPSIAYMDCWYAYRQRFFLPDEVTIPVLPDTIGVVDSIAGNEMIRLGFPEDRIKILGSPLYALLREKAGPADGDAKKNGKNHFGIPQDHFVLLFVSQEFEGHFGSVEEWGFTEITVFRDILECLKTLAPGFKNKLILNVLLHPEEEGRELMALSQNQSDVRIKFYKGESHKHIIASDLVSGMFSILLSEAVILGRPVMSLQPNLKREDMLITNMVGATMPVRTHEQFYTHFLHSVVNPDYRAGILERQKKFVIVTDAIERWSNEIGMLLNSR